MSNPDQDSAPSQFHTTAWSVVIGAQESDEDQKQRCLAELCRNYWKPIYYYIRRRGLSHDDARDITQEYFATFLEKDFVAAADRDRGRFRTFVLVTVTRFLSKQLSKKDRREARRNIPFPTDSEEEMSALPELAADETAEDDFNRRWALSIIESTMNKMKEYCEDKRKCDYYEAFRLYLDSAGDSRKLTYKDLADRMGTTETNLTNFLHRGRNIFHKLLRAQIRESVNTDREVDDEIEALKDYLRN